MDKLRAGDILSYSAGSTQTGPEGFRFVRRRGAVGGTDLVACVLARWPKLSALGASPLMFINAYPAHIGDFAGGVQVDTYLSPRTADRALCLARREGLTAVLLGQPLFVAELLLGDREGGGALPAELFLWVGGYAMPGSLQRALVERAAAADCHLEVIQFYGAAEVDAGCLIGRDLRAEGSVVYYPRGDDIQIELLDGFLTIRKRLGESGLWSPAFDTGDRAAPQDDGWVLTSNPKRCAQDVRTELEGWDASGWQRRTGYILRQPQGLIHQLRVDQDPVSESELPFHRFCERTAMSWLSKPNWS